MLIVPLAACLVLAICADTPVGLVVESVSNLTPGEDASIKNADPDAFQDEYSQESQTRFTRISRSKDFQKTLDSLVNDGWGNLDLVPTKNDIFHRYMSEMKSHPKIGLPRVDENVFSILLDSSTEAEDMSADENEEQLLNSEDLNYPAIDPEEMTNHKDLVKYGRDEYREHLHAKHSKHTNNGEEHIQMKREGHDDEDEASLECSKNVSRVSRNAPVPCFKGSGRDIDPAMVGIESKKLVAEIIMGAKPHRKDLGLCRQNLEPCYTIEDSEKAYKHTLDDVMMCVSKTLKRVYKNMPCFQMHPDLKSFLSWLITGKSSSKSCEESSCKLEVKDGFLFHRHRHKPGVACKKKVYKPASGSLMNARTDLKVSSAPHKTKPKSRDDKKLTSFILSHKKLIQNSSHGGHKKAVSSEKPTAKLKENKAEKDTSTNSSVGVTNEVIPRVENSKQWAAYSENHGGHPIFMSFGEPMCEQSEIYQ